MIGLKNHNYVEATYLVNNLKQYISDTLIDAIAVRSVHNKLDNVQYFLDYLNDVSLGGDV